MHSNDLEVGFERLGTDLTITLAGELDAASTTELEGRVAAGIEPSDRTVRLDLSGVTFCGSAGITLFIQLHNRVTDQGGTFALDRPSPSAMRTITLCQIDQVLTVTRSMAAPAD